MKSFSNYLLTLLFICFIIGIGAYVWLSEKADISFYENRTLAKMPEISVEKMLDASFTKEYETYFTDHFAGKDRWVKGYIQWQMLTNQTLIQDYYIAADDWIYPKPADELEYDQIDFSIKNVKQLSEYTQKHNMEFFLFSLPNRYLILEPPYPAYLSNNYEFKHKEYYFNELSKIDALNVIDVSQSFEDQFSYEKLKNMYYQTDHHWTVDGAFEAYKIIYNSLNEKYDLFQEPSFNEANFDRQCYDQNFIGSYNRQLYELIETDDEVCTMMPTNFDFNTLEVYVDGEKLPWDSVYGSGLNKEADFIDYAGIFTKDFRELNIINPAKEDGAKVLFIKDSYANPMSFWLAQHFYQTTFFDIRHNQDRTLYEYLNNNEFDAIVFLYNSTTVFANMYNFNLEKLKEEWID
ncbi:DHHW family protein [Lysinibacillus antri]|uniref:AlgX/AlgJ SGNH hydrolase-like domain-containing protein n=1 Tax=Lysinibacillus antri TaxID=2498145 RepID=A0A432L947_9BACI|nr:DHHW family protein [Lysinibacillus antri]RUL49817.1 hypothetical protein EK386_14775 [Lysinibacillus antri]